MVKVQESNVRETALGAPAPTARLSGEAFGGGQGRVFGSIGSSISRVSQAAFESDLRTKQKKDNALVRENLNSARSEVRQFMADVYRKKGAGAVDSYKSTEEQLGTIRKKYGDTLEDTGQKDLFAASYDSEMKRHLDRAISFQEKARLEYDHETMDAENQNAIEDAVAARSDDNEIRESEQTIIANTRAKFAGQGKQIEDKAVEDAIHNMHLEVITAARNDSPEVAQEYFKKHKSKINPKVRDRLKKELDDLAEQNWVKNKAIELGTSGKTLEQQLTAADSIKDADRSAKTKKAVKERYQEKEEIKALAQKEKYEGEVDTIFKDPIKYEGVPPSFPAAQQEHLHNLWRALRKEELAKKGIGSKVQTNWGTYDRLLKMPNEQFLKEDMTKYSTELAGAQMKQLIDMQANDKSHKSAQTLNSYINQMVKDTEEDDFGQQAFLREMFENELNNYPAEQRNSMETWNKIKDTMFMEVDVEGSIFDSSYWEARNKGQKILEPEDRPSEIPNGATWVDKTNKDGKVYRGWEHINPQGIKVIYGTDGNIYRAD